MKRILIAVFTLTLVAGAAMAQHGPGPGMGDHRPGGMGGPGDFGGGPLFVASDGTAYFTKVTADTAGAAVAQLVAVRPTGTIAWTATLPSSGRGRLVLSGTNILTVSETQATDTTVSSTITAISTASGATVWTKTLAGRAMDLTPFNGGTYVVVVTPAATTGGAATRSLVALGNDGSTLWTLAL